MYSAQSQTDFNFADEDNTIVKRTLLFILLIVIGVACNKKPGEAQSNSVNPTSGTMTSNDQAKSSTSVKDLSGTWIANEGPRVWEVSVTRVDANTFEATPTLVSNSEKDGLIDYGPPGSKGDSMIFIVDRPGTFRVRWAKAEHFHGPDFWNGSGTYDDNSFNFAGHYTGKRKS